MSDRVSICAADLKGTDIGKVVTFHWEFPVSHVGARVTGILHFVQHMSDSTRIAVSSTSRDHLVPEEFQVKRLNRVEVVR